MGTYPRQAEAGKILELLLSCQSKWRWRRKIHIVLCVFAALFLIIAFDRTNNRSMPVYKLDAAVRIIRHPRSLSLAIVVVTKDPSDNYKTATSTMRCYAGVWNYSYYLYFTEHHERPPEPKWEREMIDKCLTKDEQKEEQGLNGWGADYFFHRLCGVVEFMAAHPEHDYVLMLDNDIGVINPQRRIEEFIEADDSVNIYIYEREHQWELAWTGALMKNNAQSRYFLTRLHDMRHELPQQLNTTTEHLRKSIFFSRDNGGIHHLFLQLFASKEDREKCERLLLRDNNHQSPVDNLWEYQVCANHFLTNGSFRRSHPYYYYNEAVGRVKVLPDYQGWARDGIKGIATEGWCLEHDLMLHDWKENYKNNIGARDVEPWSQYWADPFITDPPFSAEKCVPEHRENVIQRFWRDRWHKELMLSREEFEAVVERERKRLLDRTEAYLAKIHAYLNNVPTT